MASIRIALLIFLVLAIPLRGFAATSMDLCQSSPHHGVPAAAASAAHSHDHGHAHGEAGQSSHHHGEEHPADGTHSHGSCSACGACCLGASAVSSNRIAIDFAPSTAPIPFVAWASDGVVLDRADRPPLTLLR